MQVLTPTGYVNINDLQIGDLVTAYDMVTGELIYNVVLNKEHWYPTMEQGYNTLVDPETGEEYDEYYDNFLMNHGAFTFYRVNGTLEFYKNQSIWRNANEIVHVSDLIVGDIIFDDTNNDIEITSIEEFTGADWYRMTISGDHSYIADGITLHNASRFWVGAGSSTNWNAVGNTNWSATSGGANNASVPGSSDDVTFDGAGGGNSASVVSANNTILTLTFTSGYTNTVTINNSIQTTIAGNFTDHTAHTWSMGNATSGITLSATCTVTSNSKTFNGNVVLSGASTTKTLSGDWTVTGTFQPAAATLAINKTASEVLHLGGNLTCNNSNTLTGTITKIDLTGGTWSVNTSTAAIGVNVDLNGTPFLSGAYISNGMTLKYVSGAVVTTGGLIAAIGNVTLDLAGLTIYDLGISSNAPTITLNSALVSSGSIVMSNNQTGTFAGSFGWTFASLTGNGSGFGGMTLQLPPGITYTLTNSINIWEGPGAQNGKFSITSTHATNKATLTLNFGATCICDANLTRIDASGGRAINTFAGTVTTCTNVNSFTDELMWFPSKSLIVGSGKTY